MEERRADSRDGATAIHPQRETMEDVALELKRNNRRLQALGEKAQL